METKDCSKRINIRFNEQISPTFFSFLNYLNYKNKGEVSFILLLFLFPLLVFSQTNTKLLSEIENLKADDAMKHAVWSICVIPVNKDTVLYQYNSKISLIPASTMKIATTGAALSILGKDFTFETKIEYDGKYDSVSGTINGNLYITGGGDPTLESEYFKRKGDSSSVVIRWAKILRSKGIKKITGAVIADASIFDENMTPDEWIWADMGNYYGAGACGLSYKDNKYSLYFNSGEAGTNTTILKTLPVISGMHVNNKVVAGGTDDNAYIFGAPYDNYRFVSGTIPANRTNYKVEGAIPDPALFCAEKLTIALKSVKIDVAEKPTTVRSLKQSQTNSAGKKNTLYVQHSPSLDSIVHLTNLRSINLFAESMLKYISYKKSGYGTEVDGITIIIDYWKKQGVDVSGLFMTDGCGLARANVITTKTQTEMLKVMAKDKNFNTFYNSLPVAGKSGSLGGLCEGTLAENNLHAKSGYMTRARGYAGYVKNKKGELLCFSLLTNNYDCSPTEMKKKLEKLLIALAE